jgi:hypothetical protein
MRKLLAGTAIAALAVTVAAPAHAEPQVRCAEGFEAVCLVLSAPCILLPKYFVCPD